MGDKLWYVNTDVYAVTKEDALEEFRYRLLQADALEMIDTDDFDDEGEEEVIEGEVAGLPFPFRALSLQEEKEFRVWTRDNYVPGTPVNPLWHPVVQDECSLMNEEAQMSLEADE